MQKTDATSTPSLLLRSRRCGVQSQSLSADRRSPEPTLLLPWERFRGSPPSTLQPARSLPQVRLLAHVHTQVPICGSAGQTPHRTSHPCPWQPRTHRGADMFQGRTTEERAGGPVPPPLSCRRSLEKAHRSHVYYHVLFCNKVQAALALPSPGQGLSWGSGVIRTSVCRGECKDPRGAAALLSKARNGGSKAWAPRMSQPCECGRGAWRRAAQN